MHTRLSDACATQLAFAMPSAPSFTPSEAVSGRLLREGGRTAELGLSGFMDVPTATALCLSTGWGGGVGV